MGSPKVAWPGREERKMRVNRRQREHAGDHGEAVRGDSSWVNEDHHGGILCHSDTFILRVTFIDERYWEEM